MVHRVQGDGPRPRQARRRREGRRDRGGGLRGPDRGGGRRDVGLVDLIDLVDLVDRAGDRRPTAPAWWIAEGLRMPLEPRLLHRAESLPQAGLRAEVGDARRVVSEQGESLVVCAIEGASHREILVVQAGAPRGPGTGWPSSSPPIRTECGSGRPPSQVSGPALPAPSSRPRDSSGSIPRQGCRPPRISRPEASIPPRAGGRNGRWSKRRSAFSGSMAERPPSSMLFWHFPPSHYPLRASRAASRSNAILPCPLCAATAPPPDRPRQPRRDLDRRERTTSASAGRGILARRARSVRPNVGIIGGGTAGYLAALALRKKVPGLAVTLIESPDLPIIGVGEATTPLLPQFLHVDLGLDIHTLFTEVQPTFKLGIRFLWGAPATATSTIHSAPSTSWSPRPTANLAGPTFGPARSSRS